MANTKPKIAIFYDWLNQWGGAERLLLDILKIYPKAQVFTSVYNSKNVPWITAKKIHSTWLDKLHLNKKNPLIGILEAMAIESFNFSNFDIVISITSQTGYALITPPTTCHICYCLTPNRYLFNYNYPSFLSPLVKSIKNSNLILSSRPDYFLTISRTVRTRVKQYLGRNSTVVYPGTNTDFFTPKSSTSPGDYFLIVSRLVKHKKVDLAIEACRQLNQKLIIVGQGPALAKLKNLYPKNPNIKFVGQVSDQKLLSIYQNCRALICPQEEDFGLTPLEVQACGKPVIAYSKGGITETVIADKTGVFFKYQTIQSLKRAITKFNDHHFSPNVCRSNSLRFSQKSFMLEFSYKIDSLWQLHQDQVKKATS